MLAYKWDNSKMYNTRLKKYLPGGVHYNFRLPWEETPIHFVRGKDSRLWDMDGNEYLDFYAKFGAMIVGHNNQRYNEELKKWIGRAMAVNHTDLDTEVCELIIKHIPSAEMVCFGLSGTEMVQNALRLARAYTGKNRFIRFEGNYHGNADNIMGGRAIDRKRPVPKDYPGDYKGTLGRAKDILETQSFILPWNDLETLEEVVTTYADEICAIITEPISINGGGIMPQAGYLEKMRALCDEHNIVLIFDEIITGFRVGLGGGQALLNIKPDLTTLGKAMGGGGLPVSALVGKAEIMKLYESKKVIHAGTFNGYPLGLAAVKATLEILGEDNGSCYGRMAENAAQIYEIFKSAAKAVDLPLVIQGPLTCASYHCQEYEAKSPREISYDTQFKDIVINSSLAKYGILVSSISRMYLNITLNADDIEFFRERVSPALAEAKQIIDDTFK